jgi:hypothetical protein
MAMSKIGRRRVVHSQGCEVAYNVWQFMSQEALREIIFPPKRVSATVLGASGILKGTMAKIRKEGKYIENKGQLLLQYLQNRG